MFASVFAIGGAFFTISLPIFTMFYLAKEYHSFKKEENEKRFGVLFEDLALDQPRPSSLVYYFYPIYLL